MCGLVGECVDVLVCGEGVCVSKGCGGMWGSVWACGCVGEGVCVGCGIGVCVGMWEMVYV